MIVEPLTIRESRGRKNIKLKRYKKIIFYTVKY